MSQSPQTGQFNSYNSLIYEVQLEAYDSLNPLKRVNSILTKTQVKTQLALESLNPLKRVNSILTKPSVITKAGV